MGRPWTPFVLGDTSLRPAEKATGHVPFDIVCRAPASEFGVHTVCNFSCVAVAACMLLLSFYSRVYATIPKARAFTTDSFLLPLSDPLSADKF